MNNAFSRKSVIFFVISIVHQHSTRCRLKRKKLPAQNVTRRWRCMWCKTLNITNGQALVVSLPPSCYFSLCSSTSTFTSFFSSLISAIQIFCHKSVIIAVSVLVSWFPCPPVREEIVTPHYLFFLLQLRVKKKMRNCATDWNPMEWKKIVTSSGKLRTEEKKGEKPKLWK